MTLIEGLAYCRRTAEVVAYLKRRADHFEAQVLGFAEVNSHDAAERMRVQASVLRDAARVVERGDLLPT